jgi:hypothetical protein
MTSPPNVERVSMEFLRLQDGGPFVLGYQQILNRLDPKPGLSKTEVGEPPITVWEAPVIASVDEVVWKAPPEVGRVDASFQRLTEGGPLVPLSVTTTPAASLGLPEDPAPGLIYTVQSQYVLKGGKSYLLSSKVVS